MEDYEDNPKYIAFTNQVDRALKLFETASEWMDLVSALNRLDKIFKENRANHSFPIIPSKDHLAKRLSQCLQPGTNQAASKVALDVYKTIFGTIGTNRLAQDLFIYTSGIFPFMEHVNVRNKKLVIDLFYEFLLPLGERLRPCLKGFLCSVFLGIDYPVNEETRKLTTLLDKICEASSTPIFYSALWECILTNPAIRISALDYVIGKCKSPEKSDLASYLGVDKVVAVRAICIAIQDSNADAPTRLEVQMKTLDVVNRLFPMSKTVADIEDAYLVELLTAVLAAIRLDNKLENRFYTWLFGPTIEEEELEGQEDFHRTLSRSESSPSEESQAFCYFEHYSRQILVEALKNVLDRSVKRNDLPDLNPYKILSKLLDKPEIKKIICEEVIIEVFRALYHGHALAKHAEISSKGLKSSMQNELGQKTSPTDELITKANVLFGDLPSGFVWIFCADQFERTSALHLRINQSDESLVNEIGNPDTSIIEICEILDFLLESVGLGTEHLPSVFFRVINVLSKQCVKFSIKELLCSIRLLCKIWNKIRLLIKNWDEDEKTRSDDMTSQSMDQPVEKRVMFVKTMNACVISYQKFFVEFFKKRIFDKSVSPTTFLSMMLHRQSETTEDRTQFLEHLLDENSELNETETEDVTLVDKLCQIEVPLRQGIPRLSETFDQVCRLLLELFDLQIFNGDDETQFANSSTDNHQSYSCHKPLDCPEWMQYLLLASSMLGGTLHADLLLRSITTLLQLVNKQETVIIRDSKTIVMKPILSKSYFLCIAQQTVLPLIITSKLWNGLELMAPIFHQECVQLLYQMLNIQSGSCSIEKIISRSLTSSRGASFEEGRVVGAFQRFTLFWHLSREVILKLSEDFGTKKGSMKTFDVCLMLMLDNLNKISGPLKTLTETWLVHSMTRGDLARILEPLLLTLLDPSTARVSVLHCKIDLCDTIETKSSNNEDDERASSRVHKVYGITAANGEVIHHVTGGGVEPEKKWSNNQLVYNSMSSTVSEEEVLTSTENAKRKFALNTFNESLKKKNGERTTFRKIDPFGSGEFNFFKIPYGVNPFALVPPEVQDFDSYTSGYRSTTPNAMTKSLSTPTLASSSDDTSSHSSSTMTSPSSSLHGLSVDEAGTTQLRPSQVRHVVTKIVDDLITSAVIRGDRNRKSSFDGEDTFMATNLNRNGNLNPMVQPLHSHVLLYTQVSDSKQILFSMQCIKNILQTNPRQAIGIFCTTNLNSAITPRKNQLQILLARHRKSVFGQTFVGELTPENLNTYRSSTLIEVLMSTLLYYLRSYYPNLGHVQVREEIRGNREVQLMSINIIIALVSELALMVRDSGRAFATFIYDLFTRCKVHKVVLHTLLACVNDTNAKEMNNKQDQGFTEDILLFNEVYADGNETNTSEKISNYSEAFQIQILRLLLSLVMLEQIVSQQKGEARDKSGDSRSESQQQQPQIIRFHVEKVIPEQSMFLASITSALRQDKIRHLHSHWTSLVTSCLPFLGRSLTQTVLETVAQLCVNLERLAQIYTCDDHEKLFELGLIPTDYVVTQLEALTVIYHYCLLDSYAQVNMAMANPVNNHMSGVSAPSPSSEILNNLRHVFLSTFDPKNLVTNSVADTSDAIANARKKLMAKLPRMITCCVALWSSINQTSSQKRGHANCLLVGDPKVVRAHLLGFLSPIGHHHPVAFLSAIGIAWQEFRRSSPTLNVRQVLPTCNSEQQIIVDIVSTIKSMPVATIIQTVRQVLKTPPNLEGGGSSNTEVAVLQFFYFYLEKCSPKLVFQSWSNLASLLKDCLALAPPAIFLAMAILSQFVKQHFHDDRNDSKDQDLSAKMDRKEQKELQDLAEKLVQSCTKIAGSFLEQTAWLRRNFVVRSELQEETNSELLLDENISISDESLDPKKTIHHYAVPALSLLADLMGPILDTILQSDEKEKIVVPILNSALLNVMPYLKNHSRANQSSFYASSKLLASLSDYQYMRKAWKKEAMELLLDPAFFQMDVNSLIHWKQTVDNMMTQERKTIDELLVRVNTISVGLFASKEQEMEQRAMLIKRLSFVLFSSDVDQYERQLHQIKDILTLNLRLLDVNPSPILHSAIFFCFRVILIRFSPRNMSIIWSLIIFEMVQIFEALKKENLSDSEKSIILLKRANNPDTNWKSEHSDVACKNSPAYLALFLQVCKVLDLCLALPARVVPFFQMYSWGFVSEGFRHNNGNGDGNSNGGQSSSSQLSNGLETSNDFVPHVVRVSLTLLEKHSDVEPLSFEKGQLQLRMKSIKSFDDLAPFLASICSDVTWQQFRNNESQNLDKKPDLDKQINSLLEQDFVENIPK